MQLENCDGPVTGTQLNLSIGPATAVIGRGTDVRQRAGESRGAGTPSGHRTRGAAGGNRPYLVPAIRDCSLAAFIRGAAGGNRPYRQRSELLVHPAGNLLVGRLHQRYVLLVGFLLFVQQAVTTGTVALVGTAKVKADQYASKNAACCTRSYSIVSEDSKKYVPPRVAGEPISVR